MLKFTGSVEGETQLLRSFDRFTEGVTNLEPAFEEIGIDVREILVEQFAHEGNGWTPLSPAYAIRKRRLYGDKPILRATDRMFNSLTNKGAEGNITDIHPMEASYGTSVKSHDIGKQNAGYPYPRAHQTGAGRLPQRKIFALTEANKRRITRTMQRYLVAHARRSGLQVQSDESSGTFQRALI